MNYKPKTLVTHYKFTSDYFVISNMAMEMATTQLSFKEDQK
jgi:hypothetical protein